MIGRTYSVPASAGSDRNLSRSLSPLVPMVSQSLSATPRRHSFPFWKPVTYLPARRLTCSPPRDLRQKHIQYPATGSGSVQ